MPPHILDHQGWHSSLIWNSPEKLLAVGLDFEVVLLDIIWKSDFRCHIYMFLTIHQKERPSGSARPSTNPHLWHGWNIWETQKNERNRRLRRVMSTTLKAIHLTRIFPRLLWLIPATRHGLSVAFGDFRGLLFGEKGNFRIDKNMIKERQVRLWWCCETRCKVIPNEFNWV